MSDEIPGRERVRSRLRQLYGRDPTDAEMRSWAESRAREQAAFALYPIMEREGLQQLQRIAAGKLAGTAIDTYERVLRELT